MDFEAIDRLFLRQAEFLGDDKPVNKIAPLVSVTVATYQHAAYIRQCLDGILMQETAFPYEIIIGEDGSTDGTREICEAYARAHPDRIRLFLRDRSESVWGAGARTRRFNGPWTRRSARGRYLALCEGDDYWTDSEKLAKQAAFLESHPEFSATFHNVHDLIDGRLHVRFDYRRETFTSADFVDGLICRTLSVMARRDAILSLPTTAWRDPILDYAMFWQVATFGPMHYHPEIMGVYRVHSGGMWTSGSRLNRALATYHTYRRFQNTVSPASQKKLLQKRAALARSVAVGAIEEREWRQLAVPMDFFCRHPLALTTMLFRTAVGSMGNAVRGRSRE